MASIKLLHVDRDTRYQKMVSESLTREIEGLDVIQVGTSEEALDVLERHDVDCVVSEYALWRMNGVELLRRVREGWGDLPFIMYTGEGSEGVASDAVSAGVTEYLEKEFGSEEYKLLANRVKRAVMKYRAEQEVRRTHQALETAREGISILDEDGRYVYVNEAYADLYGYEPEEMVGEHWELVYPDDEVSDIYDDILPHTKEQGFWRGETTGLRKDGSTFVEDHSLSITEEGDMICAVRDTTEERRMRREMYEQERKYSTLLSNLPGMAYRCLNERGWPMEFASEGVLELSGYGPHELVDGRVTWGEDVIHPEDRERVWREVQEALENDRPFTLTYRIVSRDEEVRYVWEQGRGVHSDGELEALEGFITDVTERKQMEKELRRTSGHLSAVIEASPIPIISLDREGRVETWNQAAMEVFGWSEEEVLGETAPIVQEGEQEDFRANLDRVLSGESFQGVEIRRRAKGGSFVDVRVSAAPVYGPDGDDGVTGVMALLEDVTKRKRDEQQLQVLNRVLRHNLRNDLNIVLGYAELVMEEASDPEIVSEAREIRSTAESLSALSDKAQQTEKTLRRSSEGESDLLDAVEAMRNNFLADYPDADITVDVPRDVSVNAQLEVAVEELVENALEHSDQAPMVRVSASVTQDGVLEVNVTDNGPGIPGNERLVLRRGEETTLAHGSGFGLWLVNWIVDGLGGELMFSENDARGTTVSMRVPA